MRLLLPAIFVLALICRCYGEDLLPGAPAPPLQIKQWIKGKPVKSLDKGIFVIDFWATWCVPCVAGMPHLSRLARTNPDVTFLAVGIWEKERNGNIRKFVEEQGSKLDLTVAYSGERDAMAKTWVYAAAQYSIPTTFVVKDGVIQWIGHPSKLDSVLSQVKSGEFDLKAFRQSYALQATEQRKIWAGREVQREAIEAFKRGERKKAHELLAKAAELDSDVAEEKAGIELGWLAFEDPKAFERAVRSDILSKDIEVEYRIWRLLEFQCRTTETHALARKTIQFILSARGSEDYLAHERASYVYWCTEDYALALKYANKALDLVSTKAGNSPLARQTLEKRIDDIKAKLGTKG